MDLVKYPPAGWKHYLSAGSSTKVYTSFNYYKSAPQALRLDGTGDYVQVQFSGVADTVSFSIRHTGNAVPYQGTFTVQESTTGSLWTTVKVFDGSNLTKVHTTELVRLKPASRYVRFYYTQKVSGWNISLDDILVKPAAPGPKPDMQISWKGKQRVNNEEIQPGNDTLLDLTIKNTGGKDTLIITSAIFGGTDALQFVVLNSLPLKVKAGSSATVQVRFRPLGAAGSRKAVLTLLSNDSLNLPFKLNYNSIKGNLATEPVMETTTFNWVQSRPWYLKLNIIAGKAEKYLVMLSKVDNAVSPADNTIYERGMVVGDNRIMWVGPESEVVLDRIEANTTYYAKLYAFNGYGGFENYLATPVGTTSITTTGLNPGSYYSGIAPSDPAFISKLQARVKPHYQVDYSDYDVTIGEEFEAWDTTGGKEVVECYYSGHHHTFKPPLKFDTMSREHTYPYSWMGETNKDSANYSDLHMLLLVHQNKANSIRSNYPYNKLKTVDFTFKGGKLGKDSSGNMAYEPRDEAKGLVARCNFYECLTYHKQAAPFLIPSTAGGNTRLQDQAVLKRWNLAFPPSNREIARHEFVVNQQGNRNPFTDNPNWACYIDFSNMSHIAGGNCSQTTSVPKSDIRKVGVYPNPARDRVKLDLSAFHGKPCTIRLYNVLEQTVLETRSTGSKHEISLNGIAAGSYMLEVSSGGSVAIETLIKNP
ncbi:MAG: endonuclease [Bacteroidetes bacterium]|nr:endonuclease [Bacteroidota bacterium]